MTHVHELKSNIKTKSDNFVTKLNRMNSIPIWLKSDLCSARDNFDVATQRSDFNQIGTVRHDFRIQKNFLKKKKGIARVFTSSQTTVWSPRSTWIARTWITNVGYPLSSLWSMHAMGGVIFVLMLHVIILKSCGLIFSANVAYKPCRGRTLKVQIDPGDSLYSEVMLNWQVMINRNYSLTGSDKPKLFIVNVIWFWH